MENIAEFISPSFTEISRPGFQTVIGIYSLEELIMDGDRNQWLEMHSGRNLADAEDHSWDDFRRSIYLGKTEPAQQLERGSLAGLLQPAANHALESVQVTEQERLALADWGLSDRQLARIKREISQSEKEPEPELVKAMKESRVLAIGEVHHGGGPENLRELAAGLMNQLAGAGATHLVLEMPSTNQKAVEKFLSTGIYDPADPDVYHHPDFDLLTNKAYQDLLLAARNAGLTVLAVDLPDYTSRGMDERNKAMAAGMKAVLQGHPENKVIFWGGDLHLDHTGEGKEYKSLSQHLRPFYKTRTVWSDVDEESPLVVLSGASRLDRFVIKPAETHAIAHFMSSDPKILKDSIPYGRHDLVLVIRK
jgi:hypothetical protein